eukprot:TRINITY_DN2425_c0_g1_i3.p2 TRINITY_DN2425_c0_g1~~TRINITY_DN2425_c0_g1_i3.p2  ORF type:complete len:130 (+),score=14.71 TRINITY_DN2425_c0_g1_i3:503-892(+)
MRQALGLSGTVAAPSPLQHRQDPGMIMKWLRQNHPHSFQQRLAEVRDLALPRRQAQETMRPEDHPTPCEQQQQHQPQRQSPSSRDDRAPHAQLPAQHPLLDTHTVAAKVLPVLVHALLRTSGEPMTARF